MSKSASGILPVSLGLGGIAGGLALAFGLPDGGGQDRAVALGQQESAKAQIAEAQQRIGQIELEIREVERRPVPISLGDELPSAFDGSLGRPALVEEVAMWDIDIRPDGQGLPEGSGDVWTGEEIFVAQCAACHGDFGEAVGRWPVLAGGHDTLNENDPVKTIGSYWPYLSTVYDYINRAMPFGYAQSLEPDDVYSITAYLLYVNDLVDDDFELSHENFAEFRLPNEENFYFDDRAETEYVSFAGEPCMSNCKEAVEITARARVIDVTPEEEGAEEEAVVSVVSEGDDGSAALIAEGETVFRKCQSCHAIGPGAANKAGPVLTGILGSTIGGVVGFNYSSVFSTAASEGRIWDDASMDAFLTKPSDYMPGTKMAFAGLRNEEDRAALIAYLLSVEGS